MDMLAYIAEFLGTAMLMLLGTSVGANAKLQKSGMRDTNSMTITIGWGLSVMLPAFIFGRASGAHFNPALTIAFVLDGALGWASAAGYILAQFAGAILGSMLMYVLFKDHFDETTDPDLIFGIFATSASIPNFWRNLLSEIVGTFILVFSIKGMEQVTDIAPGADKLIVMGIIVAIGTAFGGLTGYAINPARDLGARIAHTILPIRHKGSSHWDYAPIVLFGSMIGAVSAILLYHVIPWT